MAYRIEYATNAKYQPTQMLRKDKLAKLAIVFFLIFLLLTTLYWPQGKQMLQKMILPCDMEVTTQAFGTMIADIRGGEPLDEAVGAFCRQILSGAQIPD